MPRWNDDDEDEPAGDGWAAGSFVAGLVSLLTFCVPPLGFLVAAAGLGMGALGLKSRSRGLAVTGLVFSIVGLVFATGVGATFVIAIVAAGAKQ
jgi:hypothetical protein